MKKKWDRICSEIDSIIAEIQKDKQVDNIIHTFVNSQKENVEFEEEFKCCSYTKVPSEIYGKKYEVLDTSFQSVILIKKVWWWDKIMLLKLLRQMKRYIIILFKIWYVRHSFFYC